MYFDNCVIPPTGQPRDLGVRDGDPRALRQKCQNGLVTISTVTTPVRTNSARRNNSTPRSWSAAANAGVTHTHSGTKHWFAEADRPEYDKTAADLAFGETVAFLKAHL